MELTEEKIIEAKKYNSKLYPIYKLFGWDLLFYYSINFLFLTQAKNLTASNVLLTDSFYTIFKLIFQIPCVNIVELFGKRKSMIIGNAFVMLSIAMLLLVKNLSHVIFSNALMGFGYSLKTVCESSFLSDCVDNKEHSRSVFASIDGKGSAYWYYFDAIAAICCGFLFVFNNYLPIICCLICCIIACILSSKFLPYETNFSISKLEGTGSFKVYFKDLKIAFKNIFNSNRLKALLLFSGIFSALLIVRSTLASSLFTEIGLKEEYFGIVFALLTFMSGISSKHQNFFHKKYKNKVLTYFSLTFSISMIVIGITAITVKSATFAIIIIIISYMAQYIIKGAYYTLQKRYLNSFSSSTMSPKIYSANTLVESIFSTLMYWICSFMINYLSTAYVLAILGCIFTIVFIFILDYMKTRIGLKPEAYKKSDIYFTEVH